MKSAETCLGKTADEPATKPMTELCRLIHGLPHRNSIFVTVWRPCSSSLRHRCRCTASKGAFRPQLQICLPKMLLWNKHAVQVNATSPTPFPMGAVFVVAQRSLSAVPVLPARHVLIECLPKKHIPYIRSLVQSSSSVIIYKRAVPTYLEQSISP